MITTIKQVTKVRDFKVSDLYKNEEFLRLGPGRIFKALTFARKHLHNHIHKDELKVFGIIPMYNRPLNTFYFSYLLYSICNTVNEKEEQVIKSIENANSLILESGTPFIYYLTNLLCDINMVNEVDRILIFRGNPIVIVIYKNGSQLIFRGTESCNYGLDTVVNVSGDFLLSISKDLEPK